MIKKALPLALLILAALPLLAACSTAPPTVAPTLVPATHAPTAPPTTAPTLPPIVAATAKPTFAPTVVPTSAPTTVPPTASPTNTPASPFPTGKFIDKDDSSSYFVYTPDYRWVHYLDGERTATGRYSATSDTFTHTAISSGCVVPMSFAYAFDGKNLTFQLNAQSRQDPCQGREAYYNNKTYVLTK